MADIPHADGPYSDETKYGVAKATALEALRRMLGEYDGGWISAVGACAVRMVNGAEQCRLKVTTNDNQRYNAKIILVRNSTPGAFPFSKVKVIAHGEPFDEIGCKQTYLISFAGVMSKKA